MERKKRKHVQNIKVYLVNNSFFYLSLSLSPRRDFERCQRCDIYAVFYNDMHHSKAEFVTVVT